MEKNVPIPSSVDRLGSLFGSFPKDANNIKIVLETIPSAIVLVDAEGRFLYVNRRGRELYGIDYSGFDMDQHLSNVKPLRLDGSPFPPEEMPVSQTLMSGLTVRNVEMIIQNMNGVQHVVNVSSAPLHDNDGNISGAIVIFDDLSGQKKNEKELKDANELIGAKEMIVQRAEDQYRMLFNSIDQGFLLIDMIFDENDKPVDMYYVEANAAATRMLGRDFTGKRLREIDPAYEEYWFEIFGRVALTGQSIRMEQYAEPDRKWYSFYIFRIGDEKSHRIGNIFLDITERKKTEVAIKASEQLFRTLFENTEDGFVLVQPIFDESGHSDNYLMLDVNKAWEKQTGLKAADLVGKTIKESLPEVEPVWPATFADVVKSGKSVHFESYNSDSNRWYDLYAFNYKQDKVGVLFRDITERKLVEEALRESEKLAVERTRELEEVNRQKTNILESISDCFYALDKDLRFTYVNKAAEGIWGLSRADLIGRKIEDVFPNTIDISLSKFRQAIDEQIPQYYGVFSKVIQRWGDMSVYPTEDGISVYFRDTTERKHAEEALRESENKYRSLFESISDGFCIFEVIYDDNGRPVDIHWLEANPAYEKQSGLKDIVGKLASDVMPDTEIQWLEAYDRVIKTGEAVTFENLHEPTNRWYCVFASPINGAQSRLVATVFQDITERKREEEHERFVRDLLNEIASMSSSKEILRRTCRALGEYLRVGNVHMADMDEETDIARAYQGFTDQTVPPLEGEWPNVSSFWHPEMTAAFRNGMTVVVRNAQHHPWTIAEKYAPTGVAAFVTVPFIEEGVWRHFISVISAEPRDWREDEIRVAERVTKGVFPHLQRARAEEALRESERVHAFQSAILEAVRDPLWVSDPCLRIVYWNDAAAAAFGWTAEEAMGQHTGELFGTLIPGSTREEAVENARRTGDFFGECVLHCKDGNPIIIEGSCHAVRGPDGEVLRFVNTARDISSRKKLEEKLAFQVHALASLQEAICAVDENFNITFWNEMAEEIFGWTAQEAVGSPSKEIFRVISPSNREESIDNILNNNGYTGEAIYRKKNGKEVHTSVICSVIRDAQGNYRGNVSSFRDITESKRIEMALRESEERFSKAFWSSPAALAITRLADGTYIEVNDGVLEMMGYSREEMVGHTSLELNVYADPDGRDDLIRTLQTKGSVVNKYIRFRAKGGRIVDAFLSMELVTAGGETLILSTMLDITESKRMEAALRASEEKYRLLFNTMGEGFALYEVLYNNVSKPYDFRFIDVNPAYERWLALSKTQIIGKSMRELNPNMEQSWLDFFIRIAETGEPGVLTDYSGFSGKWIEVHAFSIKNGQIAFILRDMTERKRAEEALQESEKRKAFLLKLSDAIRPLSSAESIQDTATRILAEHIKASQANYTNYQLDSGYASIQIEGRNGTESSIIGTHKTDDYLSFINILKSGSDLVIPDVLQYSDIPEDQRVRLAGLGFQAQISVPLNKAGKLVATLTVRQVGPREWTPQEVALVHETAERTWAAVERARTEEALSKSEERLRMAINAARLVIWDADLLTWKATGYEVMEELFGVSPPNDMMQGLDIYHPDDRVRALEEFNRAMEKGGEYQTEWRMPTKDGCLQMLTIGRVVKDSAGQAVRAYGVIQDITVRKRAEEALQESEERLRALTIASTNVVYRMSPDWSSMTELYGNGFLANTEESDVNWLDKYIHPDDQEFVTGVINECIRERKTFELEHRVLQADGNIGWTYSRAVPISDGRGGIKEWFGAASDITERKRAEEALRESEGRQEFLLMLSDAIRPLADAAEIEETACCLLGLHLGVNRAYYPEINEAEGYAKVKGQFLHGTTSSMEGIYPLSAFSWSLPFLRRGEPVIIEDIHQPDKFPQEDVAAMEMIQQLSLVSVPLVINGVLVGALTVSQDTPRVWNPEEVELVRETLERTWAAVQRARAEEALHRSEEKFRVAMEISPDGFTILRPVRDQSGQIVDFTFIYENAAIARLGGTDPIAVVGHRLLELFPGHQGTPFLESYLHVAQTGESRIFEAEYGLETMPKPTWFRGVVVRMNGDIAVLAQDITERKGLEQKLESALHVAETNRLILEAVIQQMPAGIILTNATGSQARNNVAMDAIWRRKMAADENISNHAYVAFHPDGTEYKPEEWPLTRALVNDEVVIGEEMSFLRGDGTIGTLLCSSAAIKDEHGATVAGIVMDLDITDLRQAQEILVLVGEQNLLDEKEKSDSLQKTIEIKDEFLLTITHEFKTPLSVINSALQTMELVCAKDLTDKIRKYHNVIRQNSNRQLRLVNNLLDVTRMEAGRLKTEKRNVDIVAQTKSIVESITVFADQKNLKLSFASSIKSETIGLDDEKYERILLNLLSNAVKFTPVGQSIAVGLSKKTVNGKKKVCVQVQDTGIGIPADKQDVIFEKFGQVGSTRTKQAEGTGIGLHLVKQLVELLGGEIKLESKVGEGSTFTLLLPTEKDPEYHAGQIPQANLDNRLIQATALEFSDVYLK